MTHLDTKPQPILPGSTIGVLGSGQLGRMFAMAARRLGYRVHVLSPEDDTPTGQVADVEIQAAYDDLDAVARFAQQVDVVSFEFENVPVATIDVVERHAPVRPAGQVLHTTQHRLREKNFLRSAGIPVTPFQALHTAADLAQVGAEGWPVVLKTAAWGYDGKGQVRVNGPGELSAAWQSLQTDAAVCERFVDFQCELSVVAVRGGDGSFACYAPFQNSHRHHILDLVVTPADLPPGVAEQATEITRTVLEQLQVVGVLCVEFFLDQQGKLLVNELAPRPHNSGHVTLDAHATSQFEQQVRAVCGLPLGSTRQWRPAAMVNLLGDCWTAGTPDWAQALALPEVVLHLYGKSVPRPGRKMGHLTALADTPQTAAERALSARERLAALQPVNQ